MSLENANYIELTDDHGRPITDAVLYKVHFVRVTSMVPKRLALKMDGEDTLTITLDGDRPRQLMLDKLNKVWDIGTLFASSLTQPDTWIDIFPYLRRSSGPLSQFMCPPGGNEMQWRPVPTAREPAVKRQKPSSQVSTTDPWGQYRAEVQALVFKPDKPDSYTFNKFHGQSGAIQELKDLVDQVNHPDRYPGLAGLPDNVFLVGPPATGKGRFAKTVASNANCTCYRVESSCFQKPAAFWDALCHIANEGPGYSIIWIDEVDSVLSTTAKVRTQNVQRLWEDDESLPNVLFMVCTNNPSALPSAIRSRGANRINFAPLDAHAKVNIMRDMFASRPENPNEMSEDDWKALRPLLGEMEDARAFKTIVKQVAKLPARERAAALGPDGSSSDPLPPLRAIVLSDFETVLSTRATETSDIEMNLGKLIGEYSVIKEMYLDLRLRAYDPRHSCVLPLRGLIEMLSDDALKQLGATWNADRQRYNVRNTGIKIPETFISMLKKVLTDGFRSLDGKKPMCTILRYGTGVGPAGCGCCKKDCEGFTSDNGDRDVCIKACGDRKSAGAYYILGLGQIPKNSIGMKDKDGNYFAPRCCFWIPEAAEVQGYDDPMFEWEHFVNRNRSRL